MNEQNLRFRIGAFVLLSMVLLATLIMLFGGSPTLFKGHDQFTVVFDYAPGVASGTPVRRSGVRIGQVKKVDLDDATGKVRVTISIDQPHQLFEDDQAILVHGALSGDTSIDFVPPPEQKRAKMATQQSANDPNPIAQAAFLVGQVPAQKKAPEQPPGQRIPVKPGAEFIGTSQANVAAILSELSKLTPPAQEAFTAISKTLDRFDRMTPLLEDTTREIRDLAKVTRESMPELRRTNEEIQVTARNWGKVGERLDVLLQSNQDKLVKTLDNLNDAVVRVAGVFNDENQRNLSATLKNVSAGSKNLESISKNMDELLKESRQVVKPMAQRSDVIVKNLDESTDKLNKTLTDVRELLRIIGQEDGTLRRFVADPALYNNINNAIVMFTRVMPRLDRILRDFEVFADKIARHPESLGVGGVINPSSGLKEAPTSTSNFRHPPGH